MRERGAPGHAHEWKNHFDAHGIPASDVKLPLELLDDEQALTNGLFHDLPHPTLGPVRVLAPPVSMDGGGFLPASPTLPFGSETRAILGQLGFTEEAVASLVTGGVTREAGRGH